MLAINLTAKRAVAIALGLVLAPVWAGVLPSVVQAQAVNQPAPIDNPDGQDDPAEADRLAAQSDRLIELGRYTEAIQVADRVLALRQAHAGGNGSNNDPGVAQAWRLLGCANAELDRLETAKSWLQRSLKFHEATQFTDAPEAAETLECLATAVLGNFGVPESVNYRIFSENLEVARNLLDQSLALREKAGKNDVNILKTLGFYLTLTPTPESMITRINDLIKINGSKNPLLIAKARVNIALLYLLRRDFEKAQIILEEVFNSLKKEDLVETNVGSIVLDSLALIYIAQENHRKAIDYMKHNLLVLDHLGNPDKVSSEIISSNLSLDQILIGDIDGSIEVGEKLLNRLRGKPESNTAIASNVAYIMALAYWSKGETSKTIALMTEAMQADEQRLAWNLAAGNEGQKRAYAESLFVGGPLQIGLFYYLQNPQPNPQLARIMADFLLQRKGRILEILESSLKNLRDELTSPQKSQFDDLQAKRSRLAELVYSRSGRAEPANREEAARLKTDIAELETDLAQHSAAFRGRSQTVTLAALQAKLPADTALIEFVRYGTVAGSEAFMGKFGPAHYAAYVARSTGEPVWFELGPADRVDGQVANLVNDLIIRKAAFDRADLDRQLSELYDRLLAPIVAQLGPDVKRLIVAPDGELSALPLAALRDRQGQYLVERFELSSIVSGRDLLRLGQTPPSRHHPVVLGHPDYNRPGSPAGELRLRQTVQPGRNELAAALTRTGSNGTRNYRSFSDLPGTEREARQVGTLLAGAQVLMGSAATENALKAIDRPRILHIATHGFFLPDLPPIAPAAGILRLDSSGPTSSSQTEDPLLRSGLVLAGANRRDSYGEDGILTALEAAGLDLRGTQLVVLSACQTASGQATSSEGILGLRRAIAIAGAESQIGTLWLVDDQATQTLMGDLYHRLLAGEPRSAALRNSQRALLAQPATAHPYFWAAFSLVGDWRSLP